MFVVSRLNQRVLSPRSLWMRLRHSHARRSTWIFRESCRENLARLVYWIIWSRVGIQLLYCITGYVFCICRCSIRLVCLHIDTLRSEVPYVYSGFWRSAEMSIVTWIKYSIILHFLFDNQFIIHIVHMCTV